MTDDAATVREALNAYAEWCAKQPDGSWPGNARSHVALDRLAAQAARADRYEKALRKIASSDYRGNRPPDQVYAYEALNAETADA